MDHPARAALQREEAWLLFESVDGASSVTIDRPDALTVATGGIPALIRFGATVSKAATPVVAAAIARGEFR